MVTKNLLVVNLLVGVTVGAEGEGARVVGYGDGVRALEWWLIGHQPLEDSMDEPDRMERERNAKWRKIMGTTPP